MPTLSRIRAGSYPSGMTDLVTVGLVAVGGALGAGLRYGISGVVDRRIGELFPWGTLTVNVSGAVLIGILASAWHSGLPTGAFTAGWVFLVVGVLGSYTTVSSFSLQTLALARNGEIGRALLNVALSFALCPAAAAAGYVAMTFLREV
jgi:fluoride exporter